MLEFDDEREFPMTAQDFEFIRNLAYQHTGIVLPERKRHLVYSRLCRRLRALQLANFSQYCHYISNEHSEIKQFINALTTNLTAFFREAHHFDYLETTLVPLWQKKRVKRLRIWSSACSTGEEPYSIAMTLAQSFGIGEWDLKILATDLDTNVIEKAERAIYPRESIDNVPQKYKEKYLSHQAEMVRVKDTIQQLVYFKQLNLLETWPMQGPFDAIFCRNVLIYFDAETKKKIIAKFRQLLSNDGYLFIGHSETLTQLSTEFELIGQTIYKPK